MLKGPDYEDDIEKHAPRFELFFDQLRLLLSDNVEPLDDEITLPTAELSLQADTPVFFPEQLPSNHFSIYLGDEEASKFPNTHNFKSYKSTSNKF